MRTPRIYYILKMMDLKKIRRIRKFIKSPFFNEQPELSIVYEFVINFPDQIGQKNFENSLIETLYPSKADREGLSEKQLKKKVYNLVSDLNLAVQEYLAVSSLRNDFIQRSLYVTKWLGKNAESSLYKKSMAALIKGIDEHPDGFTRHLSTYLYYKNKSTFIPSNKIAKQKTAEMLDPMAEALKKAYLCARLPIAATYISRIKTFDETPEKIPWLEELQIEAGRYNNTDTPFISIYCLLLQLTTESGDGRQLLDEIFRKLKKNRKLLTRQETREIIIACTNYCTDKLVRLKEKDYIAVKSRFDRWGITKHILISEGEPLSDSKFLDLAITAMGSEEGLKNCQKFMDDNLEKVPEKTRSDTKALTMSYYCYNTGEFLEAEQWLSKIKTQKVHFAIRKHSVKIRTFYELFVADVEDYDNKLLAVLNSYKIFFGRNFHQLSKSRLESYRELGQMIYQLYHYWVSDLAGKKEIKKNLLSDLKNNSPIAADWIDEKIRLLS